MTVNLSCHFLTLIRHDLEKHVDICKTSNKINNFKTQKVVQRKL